MAGKLHAFCQLNIENVDIQTSLCCNFGIQLPQRTGRRISGVGEKRLAFRFLSGIQLFKALLRHEYLAANDQPVRCVFNGHGDGMNGF